LRISRLSLIEDGKSPKRIENYVGGNRIFMGYLGPKEFNLSIKVLMRDAKVESSRDF